MDPIENMQHGLRRALERATLSDDREIAGQLREDGRRLVFQLSGLVRLSRLHYAENAAFDRPIAEFTSTLREVAKLVGIVRLVCVEDQLYLNDVRLRANAQEQPLLERLAADLERHDVGGIAFYGPLDAASAIRLARVLAAPPSDTGDPRAALNRELVRLGVELSGRYRFHLEGEAARERGSFEDAVQRAETVLLSLGAQVDGPRMPHTLPIRRAVIDLVESTKADPARSAAEPLRRRRMSSSEHHLLAVCSLALLLGRALDLPDSELSDLGVAAMLHDVGITRATPGEDHARASARLLMHQRGFHEAKYRRLLAVLDHHRPYRPADGRRPGLFARILRIVDDYDVMVAGRSDQLEPMSPPSALKGMVAGGGSIYDPALLDLFIQVMGAYPPGTLLELSDGELAVSICGGRDPARFSWPVVRLLYSRDGVTPLAGGELDLYEVKDRTRPRRTLSPADHPWGDTVLEAVFGAAGHA